MAKLLDATSATVPPSVCHDSASGGVDGMHCSRGNGRVPDATAEHDSDEANGKVPAISGSDLERCPADAAPRCQESSAAASTRRDRLRWRQRTADGTSRCGTGQQQCPISKDTPVSHTDAATCAIAGLCPRSKLSLMSSVRLLQAPELAYDFASVLEGGAHHLKSIFCGVDDRKLFDQLRAELEGSGFWRSRKLDKYEWTIAPEDGQRSTGRITGEDAAKLARLPAHRHVLEHLAGLFDARPLAWWINLYPTGRDAKNFHKDNFGQNITIGASFGATRNLTFRHGTARDEFHFPQENGDVFAFREKVNNAFLHGMHALRAAEPDPGPRISVIMMGRVR